MAGASGAASTNIACVPYYELWKKLTPHNSTLQESNKIGLEMNIVHPFPGSVLYSHNP